MEKKEKRQARETTLKILYEQEFNKEKQNEKQALTSLNKMTQSYAHQLLKGIKTHKEKIDKLIKQTSQAWKMERISLIDLNIMRIAIYEMFYATPPIPFKVCIDESVEIAKLYGTENSSNFVNGILDTISKKTEGI
ncbi:MAG: transcription antitermination factor NusB [Bdellovibrionales bacterium]|nr:transcription antitermination factor NusB [Bdellovibrionales bacterium]